MRFGPITILLFAFCSGEHAVTAEPDATVLDGRYQWDVTGESGELRVTFSAKGEETWAVVFDFDHFGTRHSYRGTASGRLLTGRLTGEVTNEGKDRTFTFEGATTNGTFRGSHFETTGGTSRRGGTLTLTPGRRAESFKTGGSGSSRPGAPSGPAHGPPPPRR